MKNNKEKIRFMEINRKKEDRYLVEIAKNRDVWLNFDKPVGTILLKKLIEILEIIEKDEIDKDYD